MASKIEDAAVELTRWLVRWNTTNPPGDERALLAALEPRLRAAGLETRIIPYLDPARAQLIARLPGGNSRLPLLLSGHVDVVPPGRTTWEHDPFGAEVVDGRIYGRGACDMKSGVAALIVAAEEAAASGRTPLGDLWLVLTADEERNCLGAEELARQDLLPRSGAVIVAEPTGLRLYLAEKGAFWVQVEATGKTAHASIPHLGVNAVDAAMDLAVRWKKRYEELSRPHDFMGSATLNVGVIEGGVKVNVVPDRCVLQMDMRTVPPMDHDVLASELRLLADQAEREVKGAVIHLSILSNRPPVECRRDSDLAQALAGAVAEVAGVDPAPLAVPYCTEACIWQPQLGLDCVICGPGEPGMAHQPDESVDVAQVEFAARIYSRVVSELLFE